MNAPLKTASIKVVETDLRPRYLLAHAHRVALVLAAVAWLALICWGIAVREEDYISASSGLGYALGLGGGIMVLLLLTYSLRKRVRALRNLFHLRYWFRLHMTLGVLAPTAILFHSRFSFGSPNSTVALICLLTVATSGLVGRFLYNHIHAGVYGERIKLAQVCKDFATLRESLLELAVTPQQKTRVDLIFAAIEQLIVSQRTADLRTLRACRQRAEVIGGALDAVVADIERYHQRHPEAHMEISRARGEIHACVEVMHAILAKLPGLHLFDRLFSLWHVVHLPIFGLMLVSAITHVIVVHMY